MRFLKVLTKKSVLLVIFFLLLIIILSYPYVLRGLGYFLIFEQKPQKADVIVVLNGRDTERSLTAVDLYNKGYANLIVLAKGSKEAGHEELWHKIGNDFDRRIFFQRAIEAMGIPKNSFKLIGDGVTSTYDEARVTKEFMKENGYKSILLVTSKWHSKRAYLTFQSVLNNKGNGIKITIIPSRYDTFDPEAWWKSEEDAKSVFGEYVRLFYYVVRFRISPLDIISRD